MPGTSARTLTLTPFGQDFKLIVTYNAQFTAFERNLAGLGMRFLEKITAFGVDAPGTTTGEVIFDFPSQTITIPPGNGPIGVARTREVILTRKQLDEDKTGNFGSPDVDADEIKCRIQIESSGLPPAITGAEFTNQKVLGGFVPA